MGLADSSVTVLDPAAGTLTFIAEALKIAVNEYAIKYGQGGVPELILYYTYAVLYAPTYRQTYVEFLKSDFPHVPFTTDYELFGDLAKIGRELTELHLMKSDKLNDPIAKFQGEETM